eukprot:m.148848 g.148848  ORF g.148848 m.148848 type:complete len:605 (-) comp30625_c0_seq2:373-2187(-)
MVRSKDSIRLVNCRNVNMHPPKTYRSHTILIIDFSGSMRTRDVSSGIDQRITRHNAVFDALNEGVFKPQILHVTSKDVVTMVKLSDDATAVLDTVPFAEAAKRCGSPAFVDNLFPKSHGRYLPALDMLGEALRETTSLCTNVLFFSDGTPSDSPPPGKGVSAVQKVRKMIVEKTHAVCQQCQAKAFSFHTVGFGLDDFSTLKEMAAAVPLKQGKFHHSKLDLHALTSTLSSFSTSVSHSITNSSGPHRPLVQVQVTKHCDDWIPHEDVRAWFAEASLDAKLEKHPKHWCVRVSKDPFDRGGLRNVFNLRFKGADVEWVAKRDKHVVSSQKNNIEFHRKHMATQGVAKAWADKFSGFGIRIGHPTKIKFLDCWLMQLEDGFVFVEQKLQGEYTKWNSNNGKVKNLNSTTEVLQAFSHYTHHESGGTKLVCDLQGVYNAEENTFSLVDPVIHSTGGSQGRFGKTDLGQEGMNKFFRSHKCNKDCVLFGLPPNRNYKKVRHPVDVGVEDPFATVMAHSATSATITTSKARSMRSMSRNTSDVTVIKTHHLAQRQDERDIRTRELQSAVKRGHRSCSGNRLMITHKDINYITDKTARIGITTYHPDMI